MNCIFKVLRNLFFTQVSKYFPKNLRLKILLIVQRVVQIVIPETSPLPPRQCEVWEDWQFREGPQSERHGGVGGRAVEADDVVEDGTEAEAVLEVGLAGCCWLPESHNESRGEEKRGEVTQQLASVSHLASHLTVNLLQLTDLTQLQQSLLFIFFIEVVFIQGELAVLILVQIVGVRLLDVMILGRRFKQVRDADIGSNTDRARTPLQC